MSSAVIQSPESLRRFSSQNVQNSRCQIIYKFNFLSGSQMTLKMTTVITAFSRGYHYCEVLKFTFEQCEKKWKKMKNEKKWKKMLCAGREWSYRTGGTQKGAICTRSGIPQAANAVHLRVVLSGPAYVSKPFAIDSLSVRSTDRSCSNQGGNSHTDKYTNERQTDRQTDRQTSRQTETETERNRDRDRQTERVTVHMHSKANRNTYVYRRVQPARFQSPPRPSTEQSILSLAVWPSVDHQQGSGGPSPTAPAPAAPSPSSRRRPRRPECGRAVGRSASSPSWSWLFPFGTRWRCCRGCKVWLDRPLRISWLLFERHQRPSRLPISKEEEEEEEMYRCNRLVTSIGELALVHVNWVQAGMFLVRRILDGSGL